MPTFDSTDLDNAASESGVVHESVTNTDHNDASNLKQGYAIANPYLSADLVGYWPLHEDSGGTAYDFSGNNNDGTTNGGVTQGATGLLGTSAYSFDGTDDWVDVPNGLTTFDGSSGFTVAGWINTDTLSTDGWIFAPFSDNSFITAFGADVGTDDTFGARTDQGGWFNPVTTTWPETNAWHHFAVTYDTSNGWVLYVDASQKDTNGSTGSISSQDDNNVIGGREFHNDYWYNGQLADFRIYGSSLTSSEVQYLYDVVAGKSSLQTQFKTV